MTNEVLSILKMAGFSENILQALNESHIALEKSEAWKSGSVHNRLTENFTVESMLPWQSEAAQQAGVPLYTVQLMHLLVHLPSLRVAYSARAIKEEYYIDMVRDFLSKTQECITMEGYPGTMVYPWHMGFMNISRYALGRLQYEDRRYPCEDTRCAGLLVRKGERIVGMHIPSGRPLDRAACIDSLKKAYLFYGCDARHPLIVHCSSWLLNPDLREMLTPPSNMLDFLNLFQLVDSRTQDVFHDAWRVFGPASQKPVEEWPTDTRLRRAYAEWLLAGKKIRTGDGLLVFDGSNVLTEKRD